MRTVKEPDVRKQEILDGAIHVFAEKGYDKTSITDIAKAIGISQGLCYRYFSSKEEIYDAAIDEYANYIVNGSVEHLRLGGRSLKEQIRMMSGRTGGLHTVEKQQSDLYTLFHKSENHKMHDQLSYKVASKLVPYIAASLQTAKERGEITITNPEIAAYFIIYGQMGILMDEKIQDEEGTIKMQNCLLEMLGMKE